MWRRKRENSESDDLARIRSEVDIAERALDRVRARRAEIARISSDARERLERNHFGEALEQSMKRR